MGMPCEVNSVLKLNELQCSPTHFERGSFHEAFKGGYRIIPLDIPISLIDKDWRNVADIIVRKLTWENNETFLRFEIVKLHETPFINKKASHNRMLV